MKLNGFENLEPVTGGTIPVGSYDMVITQLPNGQETIWYVWNPNSHKVTKAVKECCEFVEDGSAQESEE